MGARDIKTHKAKTLKTKSDKVQRKSTPPNKANTLLNTDSHSEVSEQRDGEDQISHQESDDDRISSNKKHS